jgi:exodeoxyribonuclease VII small subunit
MAKKKTAENGKPPSFEKSKELLEAIVEELESGELELEKAMARYQEGLKAYRLCNQILTEAEKIVDVLTRDAEGALKSEPFEEEKAADDDEDEDAEEEGSGEKGSSLF